MPKRSKSYDEYISKRLINEPDFAKSMVLTSIEEFNESVEEALKYTISRMGVKEFSEVSGIPAQNVTAFIKGRRNLKRETLDKYLSFFGLASKIIVVDSDEVA